MQFGAALFFSSLQQPKRLFVNELSTFENVKHIFVFGGVAKKRRYACEEVGWGKNPQFILLEKSQI